MNDKQHKVAMTYSFCCAVLAMLAIFGLWAARTLLPVLAFAAVVEAVK